MEEVLFLALEEPERVGRGGGRRRRWGLGRGGRGGEREERGERRGAGGPPQRGHTSTRATRAPSEESCRSIAA